MPKIYFKGKKKNTYFKYKTKLLFSIIILYYTQINIYIYYFCVCVGGGGGVCVWGGGVVCVCVWWVSEWVRRDNIILSSFTIIVVIFSIFFVLKTLIHVYKDTGFHNYFFIILSKMCDILPHCLSYIMRLKKQISVNLNIRNRTFVIILQALPHF